MAHSSTVNCLALSPSNGRTLATGGDDRRVNLWMVGQPNALMVINFRHIYGTHSSRSVIGTSSVVIINEVLNRGVLQYL